MPRFSLYWNKRNYDGSSTIIGPKKLAYSPRGELCTIAYTEEFIEKYVGSYSPKPTAADTVVTYLNGNISAFNISGELSSSIIPSKSNIVDVVIGTNVTSIGEKAFDACYELTNAVIPDSIISIGN